MAWRPGVVTSSPTPTSLGFSPALEAGSGEGLAQPGMRWGLEWGSRGGQRASHLLGAAPLLWEAVEMAEFGPLLRAGAQWSTPNSEPPGKTKARSYI